MRNRRIVLFVLLIAAFLLLASCAKTEADPNEGKIKVVYELEGGEFQNCYLPVVHYYSPSEGGTTKIFKMTKVSGREDDFVRPGYTLTGWFRTKTEVEGKVVYSDPWNFDTDTVGMEGVTLYARWEIPPKYTYNVCYWDENGNRQLLGTYDVKENQIFSDYKKYAKRQGFTEIGFLDAEGNKWNSTFKHPGGGQDLAVDVFVEYVEGNFKVITSASQLASAGGSNIYLAADIDFKGGNFAGFDRYSGVFMGNGHKISNFNLQYHPSNLTGGDPDLSSEGGLLSISLFRNLTDAKISDVTFENVSIEVKTENPKTKTVIVSPLSVKMSNCEIRNVRITGKVQCTALPDAASDLYWRERMIVNLGEAAYFRPAGDLSTIERFENEILDQTGDYFAPAGEP